MSFPRNGQLNIYKYNTVDRVYNHFQSTLHDTVYSFVFVYWVGRNLKFLFVFIPQEGGIHMKRMIVESIVSGTISSTKEI